MDTGMTAAAAGATVAHGVTGTAEAPPQQQSPPNAGPATAADVTPAASVTVVKRRYWFSANGMLDSVVGKYEFVGDLCRAIHGALGSLSSSAAGLRVSVAPASAKKAADEATTEIFIGKEERCADAIPTGVSLPPRSPGSGFLLVSFVRPGAAAQPPKGSGTGGSKRRPSSRAAARRSAADNAAADDHAKTPTTFSVGLARVVRAGKAAAEADLVRHQQQLEQEKTGRPPSLMEMYAGSILRSLRGLESSSSETGDRGAVRWVALTTPIAPDYNLLAEALSPADCQILHTHRVRGGDSDQLTPIRAAAREGTIGDGRVAFERALQRQLGLPLPPVSVFYMNAFGSWILLTDASAAQATPLLFVVTKAERALGSRIYGRRTDGRTRRQPTASPSVDDGRDVVPSMPTTSGGDDAVNAKQTPPAEAEPATTNRDGDEQQQQPVKPGRSAKPPPPSGERQRKARLVESNPAIVRARVARLGGRMRGVATDEAAARARVAAAEHEQRCAIALFMERCDPEQFAARCEPSAVGLAGRKSGFAQALRSRSWRSRIDAATGPFGQPSLVSRSLAQQQHEAVAPAVPENRAISPSHQVPPMAPPVAERSDAVPEQAYPDPAAAATAGGGSADLVVSAEGKDGLVTSSGDPSTTAAAPYATTDDRSNSRADEAAAAVATSSDGQSAKPLTAPVTSCAADASCQCEIETYDGQGRPVVADAATGAMTPPTPHQPATVSPAERVNDSPGEQLPAGLPAAVATPPVPNGSSTAPSAPVTPAPVVHHPPPVFEYRVAHHEPALPDATVSTTAGGGGASASGGVAAEDAAGDAGPPQTMNEAVAPTSTGAAVLQPSPPQVVDADPPTPQAAKPAAEVTEQTSAVLANPKPHSDDDTAGRAANDEPAKDHPRADGQQEDTGTRTPPTVVPIATTPAAPQDTVSSQQQRREEAALRDTPADDAPASAADAASGAQAKDGVATDDATKASTPPNGATSSSTSRVPTPTAPTPVALVVATAHPDDAVHIRDEAIIDQETAARAELEESESQGRRVVDNRCEAAGVAQLLNRLIDDTMKAPRQ